MPPSARPSILLRLAGVAAAAGLLLAGCGGGGSGGGGFFLPGAGGGGSAPDTGRGSLVGSPSTIARLSANEFRSLLQADAKGRALLQVTGAPVCGVALRSITYRTVGGAGEDTSATAAVMVPAGTDPACNGSRPIVLYAHGTTTARDYNIARWIDPNQPAAAEGVIVAAMFAAQGYTVVAPNYAGYDASPLPYHPYLNADQQSKDMIDALKAARTALPLDGVSDAGSLLVTGYSQGGFVALATHRAMQAAGQSVTASAPLSAPSAISLLIDYSFSGWPALGSTVFVPLITTSWQKQFGNVYGSTSDIYEAQYAPTIETLLPSLTPLSTIIGAGQLPQTALFPANGTPGPVDPALSAFYGPNNLVRQSYLTQVANDITASPCPGNALPASGASLSTPTPLDCRPATGLRRAAVANDLRNWTPARPVFMCGGAQDPTVNFTSTLATAGYFRAKGVPPERLTVLDLEQAGGTGDPYAAARAGLAQAKAQVYAAAEGDAAAKAQAVTVAYHGTLVPPLCLVSARGYFAGLLGAGG
ncbi:MAG: alpha/beta hydrolase [Variovorax paradoxus]|uniref:Alpha/beta hydrolase n=1 Tax=Variovorax paradoxus TaxID=34073 RepID=A0A2W5RTC2_VARPD|nr:MAG: alpha/beta hydrolase [Variovorax paradoxus]